MHEASRIHAAHAVNHSRTQPGAAHGNARLWSVGQRSETGYVRSENQDRMSWIRTKVADVFVVSDGMGGHAGGATAASITVQTLQETLQGLSSLERASVTLEHALQAANAAVYTRGQMPDPTTVGMGATAVVLLAAADRIMLAHVGDSRAYLLDRSGVLRRLTKDHSVVQRMIDAGVLTESEAANHPDSSVLERALGQTPHVPVEVGRWLTVQQGELCMLCSDGLCGYVSDDAIAAAMHAGGAPQAIADRLVRLALEQGGEDNVTVQVLRCGAPRATLLRRWVRRGGLALAALCAAVTAMVWAGWISINGGERPDAGVGAKGSPKASSASNTAVPATASAVGAPVRDATGLAVLETQIARIEREQQQAVESYRQKLDLLYKKRDSMRAALALGAQGASPPASETRVAAASAPTHASEAGPTTAASTATASALPAASAVRRTAASAASAVHKAAAASVPKRSAKPVQHKAEQGPPKTLRAQEPAAPVQASAVSAPPSGADQSDIDR